MSTPAMIEETMDDEEEEFGFTECECCGMTEECTANYAAAVRARCGGWWICGLCAEAVDEEICRSSRVISTEEAIQRQRSFCLSFRSATFPPADSGDHLIAVVRRLIRRSLDSPPHAESSSRKIRSVSGQKENCVATVGDADLVQVKGLNFD